MAAIRAYSAGQKGDSSPDGRVNKKERPYSASHKRDSLDSRDYKKELGAQDIPSADHPVVDLRKYVKHVYHQVDSACCTASALCAAYELIREIQAEKMGVAYCHKNSSLMFVYYNSRKFVRATGEEDGATARDTLKAMQYFGVCQESLWPFDMAKIVKEPPQECYDNAAGNKIVKYKYLEQNIDQFRACLKAGFPFGFGFLVYEKSWDTISENGLMPLPTKQESSGPRPGPEDYHYSLAVGYDDTNKCITVLGSYGDEFGDKGYIYMPYDYIIDPKTAWEFWTIEM